MNVFKMGFLIVTLMGMLDFKSCPLSAEQAGVTEKQIIDLGDKINAIAPNGSNKDQIIGEIFAEIDRLSDTSDVIKYQKEELKAAVQKFVDDDVNLRSQLVQVDDDVNSIVQKEVLTEVTIDKEESKSKLQRAKIRYENAQRKEDEYAKPFDEARERRTAAQIAYSKAVSASMKVPPNLNPVILPEGVTLCPVTGDSNKYKKPDGKESIRADLRKAAMDALVEALKTQCILLPMDTMFSVIVVERKVAEKKYNLLKNQAEYSELEDQELELIADTISNSTLENELKAVNEARIKAAEQLIKCGKVELAYIEKAEAKLDSELIEATEKARSAAEELKKLTEKAMETVQKELDQKSDINQAEEIGKLETLMTNLNKILETTEVELTNRFVNDEEEDIEESIKLTKEDLKTTTSMNEYDEQKKEQTRKIELHNERVKKLMAVERAQKKSLAKIKAQKQNK